MRSPNEQVKSNPHPAPKGAVAALAMVGRQKSIGNDIDS
jgi:hypothetical protein